VQQKKSPGGESLVRLLLVPKIFEKDGYRFFFYSNEHRPIHVHVRRGSGEAVFEVEQRVELRESQGLKVGELAKAEALAVEQKYYLTSLA
jgi:hypothetical protein